MTEFNILLKDPFARELIQGDLPEVEMVFCSLVDPILRWKFLFVIYEFSAARSKGWTDPTYDVFCTTAPLPHHFFDCFGHDIANTPRHPE